MALHLPLYYSVINSSINFTVNMLTRLEKGGEKMTITIKQFSAAASALVLTVSLFAGTAFAAGTDHLGPFAGSTPDGGSCGVPWAQDTYNISFSVHDNGDGTFNVRT